MKAKPTSVTHCIFIEMLSSKTVLLILKYRGHNIRYRSRIVKQSQEERFRPSLVILIMMLCFSTKRAMSCCLKIFLCHYLGEKYKHIISLSKLQLSFCFISMSLFATVFCRHFDSFLTFSPVLFGETRAISVTFFQNLGLQLTIILVFSID